MTDDIVVDGGRLRVPIPLRWGDLDAFNHVNNTAMLKLLEKPACRCSGVPVRETAPPTAVLDTGIDAGALTLVARQEIEYFAPVPYRREPLDVQLWFGALGGSSVDVCYDVFSSRGIEPQVLYARASTVIVMADAATGRPMRLTDEMRAAWEPFLGEPVKYRYRR